MTFAIFKMTAYDLNRLPKATYTQMQKESDEVQCRLNGHQNGTWNQGTNLNSCCAIFIHFVLIP